MEEMQRRVDAWIAQFEAGYFDPLTNLARLTEEVGELAREVNHRFGQKTRKPEEPEGDMAMEMADILFVLICLANREALLQELQLYITELNQMSAALAAGDAASHKTVTPPSTRSVAVASKVTVAPSGPVASA